MEILLLLLTSLGPFELKESKAQCLNGQLPVRPWQFGPFLQATLDLSNGIRANPGSRSLVQLCMKRPGMPQRLQMYPVGGTPAFAILVPEPRLRFPSDLCDPSEPAIDAGFAAAGLVFESARTRSAKALAFWVLPGVPEDGFGTGMGGGAGLEAAAALVNGAAGIGASGASSADSRFNAEAAFCIAWLAD